MNSFAQHHKGLITIFQNPITWEVRPNITISFILMIIEQVKPLNARPDVSITLFNKAIYSSNKNKGNLKIRRINVITYKTRNRWLWPSGSRGLCLRLVVRCRITGTSWRRELKWVCSKNFFDGFRSWDLRVCQWWSLYGHGPWEPSRLTGPVWRWASFKLAYLTESRLPYQLSTNRLF